MREGDSGLGVESLLAGRGYIDRRGGKYRSAIDGDVDGEGRRLTWRRAERV